MATDPWHRWDDERLARPYATIDMRGVGLGCQSQELTEQLSVLGAMRIAGWCSAFGLKLLALRAGPEMPDRLRIVELELTLSAQVPNVRDGREVTLNQTHRVKAPDLVRIGARAWVRDCLVAYLTHEANEAIVDEDGSRPFDPHVQALLREVGATEETDVRNRLEQLVRNLGK